MNKTKRVLSVVLAVLMLSSLIAALAIADDETVKFRVEFQFTDGKQAANPWVGTVAKGEAFNQTIQLPTVKGYEPRDGDNVLTEVSFNVASAQEGKTIKVIYYPALVDLTVKHYQQNITDDKYTLAETEVKSDTHRTGDEVGKNLEKSYPGFTALLYDTTTKVAADGSTVVEIYYDRNLYLMSFNLDGGYGVEPIYARFGAPVKVGTPTKPGYTFNGWEPTVPETVPAENKTYKAKWQVGESGFTVVFWYENANDDGYSYAGSIKPANVAPGTQKSSGDYKDSPFTGRDDTHFTYNAAKAETVTVKGDGSTVLNVYYTRNTYTLTFVDGNVKLVCGKVEHTHSHDQCCTKTGWHLSCNSNKCPVGYEHKHTTGNYWTSSCYETSDVVITAKWDADISSYFPILDANGNAINWNVSGNVNTVAFDVMPDVSRSYTADGTISNDYNCFYYLEIVEGTTTDAQTVPLDGKTFALYKKVPVPGGVSLTYKEEFHDILGFTQYKSDPKFASVDSTPAVQKENKFYYTRNSYNLQFFNYNGFIADKEERVQYEAPLKGKDFTPNYPAGPEANAYEFAGWYTTEGCFDGSEVDWDNAKMPAGDVILYAKWAPKTHTVRTWLTDKLDKKVIVGETGDNVQSVAHGSFAIAPETPTNGNYTFAGWFYEENGEVKAFDFKNVPVRKDLDIFAKWSSNTLVTYTIKYELEDGTEIAAPTTGSALAGTTKTFDAKTGDELNEGYRKGYFPETGSHSIEMKIDGDNEFTFVYVAKEKVKYTVKYLEKGTNAVLHEEKTGETSDAIITEKFEQINGYAPDAYQKRLVLSATESENVITFWYTKDEVHAPVQIIHWVQNIEGDGYTEYQSSVDTNAEINKTQTSTALTIPGFNYVRGTAVVGETTNEFTAPNTPSGTLTAAGLVLNLYYDRIEYPYEFRFVDRLTGEEIPDTRVSGEAKYQAQVTQAAKDLEDKDYLRDDDDANKAIIIGTDASKNIKTFYYLPFFKVVHVQGGTIAGTDKVKITQKDNFTYSLTDAVSQGYLYGGAFTDEECTSVQAFKQGENAMGFTPERGETYYIWEVHQNYLKPRAYVVWRHDPNYGGDYNVVGLYLTSSIDRNMYQYAGFTVNGENFSSRDVYETVQAVYENTDTVKEEMYVDTTGVWQVEKEAPSKRGGYVSMYTVDMDTFYKTTAEKGLIYQPYWVTLDGIKVTGTYEARTCTYLGHGTDAKYQGIGITDYVTAKSSVSNYTTTGTQTIGVESVAVLSAAPETVQPEVPVTPEIPEVPEAPEMTLNSDAMYLRAQYTYEMMTNTVKFISAIDVNACTEYGFVINGEVVKCEEAAETVDGYDANYLFGGSVNGAMLMSCNMLLDGLVDGMTLNVTPYYVAPDGTVVYGETRTLVYRQWVGLEG